MITFEMQGANFAVVRTDAGDMALLFQESGSAMRFLVPFQAEGWAIFKRHVANDGQLPAGIEIARSMPNVEGNGA